MVHQAATSREQSPEDTEGEMFMQETELGRYPTHGRAQTKSLADMEEEMSRQRQSPAYTVWVDK